MLPSEIELNGQQKLNKLFKKLKSLLQKGQLDPGLVDEIELLAEELKENRLKIDSISIEEKQRINDLITENRQLFSEIMHMLKINIEIVDSLKELFSDKTGTYRIVDGKIIEE